MQKVIQFIKEVKIELLKVTWPKKDELVGSTTIVLVLSILLTVFLWIADLFIGKILFFFMTK
ncbi:MAG: preprotein translocase subunit SecE [Candidatus Cloacimonas sp. 4484_209]|nr:MAG: preprotein translocase subunit SecE [Candidatus Cloacimonas sp. 4484_209]